MTRALVLALTLLAACSKAQSDGPAPGGGGEAGGPPPMPVEVALAQRDTVVDAISATGQIEPIQSVDLRPEVEGRIVEILIREGQAIAEGTPLFKVDDAELKAQVARAAAEHDLARQALERTQQLIGQNASSAADLERAEATARGAAAQLALLQIRLDRTVVRAPFAGVVGRRYVSLGDYVNTGSRLAAVQTVDPQYAVFQVPERYAERLARGQRVSFGVAALPGRSFSGRVVFVDPAVQLPSRTILIKAVVRNPRRELSGGMFIEARLTTGTRLNAVVVPEDAILPLQGATFVWVVKDGKADQRQVTIGVRTAGWAEVLGGVAAGDQVVVGGLERLFPGATVMANVVERPRATP